MSTLESCAPLVALQASVVRGVGDGRGSGFTVRQGWAGSATDPGAVGHSVAAAGPGSGARSGPAEPRGVVDLAANRATTDRSGVGTDRSAFSSEPGNAAARRLAEEG